MAVGILTDPAAHRGKTYVPTGPVSLSLAEMAAVFTRVLGRPVEYVDIPVERWRRSSPNSVMSPHFIEHMSRVAEAHQHGEFDAVTDVVQTIGGAPPQSLEAFIRQNAAAFGLRDEELLEFGASLNQSGRQHESGDGDARVGIPTGGNESLRPEVKPDAVH